MSLSELADIIIVVAAIVICIPVIIGILFTIAMGIENNGVPIWLPPVGILVILPIIGYLSA